MTYTKGSDKIESTNNHRSYLICLFVFIIFTIGYGAFESSKNRTDLVVNIANAGVAKCGCSKCHTIELNGCVGCHNKQQNGQKSNDSMSQPKEAHGKESANLENTPESLQKQSSSVENTKSKPIEPKNEELGKSETNPKKSKTQQGSDQHKK